LIKLFYIIFLRDFKETFIDGSKSWFTISFFILCLLTFPLAIGSNDKVLEGFSVAAIWISALFANLLSLENMYKDDYENGIIEQYFISRIPLYVIVFVKCFNHWLFSGLPIILLSPFCLYVLSDNSENFIRLFTALSLGTFLFTFIGSPIAALTLGSKARSPLLAFLTLPFYLPIIIFGILSSSLLNGGGNAEFYLLSSLLSLSIILMPFITVKILEFVLE